jgi:hypothetical protein
MALIATAIDPTGVARIFFDLRPATRSLKEEKRIAATIERANAVAVPETELDGARRAA